MADDDAIYEAAATSLLVLVFVRRPKRETKSSNLLIWPPAAIKTLHNPETCNFFKEATPTDNNPVGVAKISEGKEGVTIGKTPTGHKRASGLERQNSKTLRTPINVHDCGPRFAISDKYANQHKVCCKPYEVPSCQHPHQNGCERDGSKSHPDPHLLAGKLRLFAPNWQVITKDLWVMNCVQGYTIDWVGQPHQTHPPAKGSSNPS